jgi:RNA polymerase-binding protein DksA
VKPAAKALAKPAAKAPAPVPAKSATRPASPAKAAAPALAKPQPPAKAAPAPAAKPKSAPITKGKPKPAPRAVAVEVVQTPAELERIRRRLLAKQEEILAMYRNDLRSGQESNDSPTEDIVDRANNAYSRELSYSISDAERGMMLQIEEALGRIDAGTYGRCANCGQPIAAARLEAVPWTRHCINCQELLEKGLLGEA